LIENSVDVGKEALRIYRWSVLERSDYRCSGSGLPAPHGSHLGDGNAIASNDERFSAIDRAHDGSTLVPKFTLGDFTLHEFSVAQVPRGVNKPANMLLKILRRRNS
jgi:hypothetical protein